MAPIFTGRSIHWQLGSTLQHKNLKTNVNRCKISTFLKSLLKKCINNLTLILSSVIFHSSSLYM